MSRRMTARPLSLAGPARASRPTRAAMFVLTLAAVTLMLALSGARAAPAPASVEAVRENGFGRIVLTFKDRLVLPEYTSKSANGVLVVTFAEAVSVTTDTLPIELPDYISIARSDPDGSAVRIALKRGVKVNLMDAGEKLFIDLLPPSWRGMPPPLPAEVVSELARRAKEALMRADEADRVRRAKENRANLVVYAAEAPTFTRLTFEWDRPFNAAFSRDGDTVTVAFNQFAEIDLSVVRAQPPAGLAAISSSESDKGLGIHITVQPNTGIRAFQEGQTYIVDLTQEDSPALNPVARKIRDELRHKVGASNEVVIASPRQSDEPVVAPQDMPQETVSSRETTEPLQPMPPEISGIQPEQTAQSTKNGEAGDGDGQARPVRRLNRNPEALPKVTGHKANFVRAEARRVGNGVRVKFPFSTPVSSASFQRGDTLWMVFDTPIPFDTRAIRSTLQSKIADFSIRRDSATQTIRMVLKEPLLTTVGLDGNAVVFSFGETILEPTRPLSVERGVSSHGGAVLKVPYPEAGSVHVLTDPVVGDQIHVVTGFGKPRGLITPQAFVDLEILPSTQGVAVVARADDLTVALQDDVVEIGRESGLMLSNSGFQSSIGPLVDAGSGDAISNGETTPEIRSRTLNPLEHRRREVALREAIVSAPKDDRNDARLKLARFYLAERMPNEALGILRVIHNADAKYDVDPTYLVLVGAAQSLLDRAKEARGVLDKPVLDKSPDAAFWRTIAYTLDGDWQGARAQAPRARPVLGGYPPDLQNEFLLSAALSSIQLNDFGLAERLLGELIPEQLSAAHRARYDLLRGRVAEAGGRMERALALYDRVGEGRLGASAIEAQYRALKLRHREGKISAADAAKKLEQLSLMWRGDEVELEVLRMLAAMSVETGNYRRAFETMKTAIVAAPDSETSRTVQDEMTAVFASLFLDHKADALPPVKALTLYYDFRELTPPGRRGDEMVRDLAARLIDVDLLDQAAELLQHQIDHRLKGVARAQIAADLGVVYLLNHKPDRALGVLSRTRQARLPVELDRQRRLVEARALAGTNRIDRAMDLIHNLEGSDVDRLRADILWDAERWRAAGEQIEGMLGRRWSDEVPLGAEERLDVLRAAIAYSRADDQLSLDRLRSKYASKMADSDHARAFDVVTRPIVESGSAVEFAEVARQIASINTLESFLKEYRSQYLTRDPGDEGGVAETVEPGPSPDAATPANAAPDNAPAPTSQAPTSEAPGAETPAPTEAPVAGDEAAQPTASIPEDPQTPPVAG